ncbi:hypothetical protein PanWU01x14_345510 [Parasponia andersonii]|uniref:Uncharacterized protein n=1 Tax=Parasponia andersonii TaxID=3476 RepID=A0A2P5ACM9_PARAD|nr:hypothetical protein PanWU01x14_345510 [Parasponia andersonii]
MAKFVLVGGRNGTRVCSVNVEPKLTAALAGDIRKRERERERESSTMFPTKSCGHVSRGVGCN